MLGIIEELMLIKDLVGSTISPLICSVCGQRWTHLGSSLGVCPKCICDRWEESRDLIEVVHRESREAFQLPIRPPQDPEGITCNLCFHKCRMTSGQAGYCTIRRGTEESLRLDGRRRSRVSYYYDPLPTNCVADWVCPGGTGAGYPDYSHDSGTEVGFYNLAVFFEACNLNCLFCQNWSFKQHRNPEPSWRSIDSMTKAVNGSTSCICFFGGDPAPQIPFALRFCEEARRKRPNQILRICWETNGSMHPSWLKRMAWMSLESGGCIKMDLKAWNPQIHKALCGFDNRHILENFSRLAEWVPLRPDPPLLVASTLLVPGYVGEEEVSRIASFIARLNPSIPYALLGFAPQFCMEDFPTTSRDQAEACLQAAKRAGLRRVRLGNQHLIY
jgi:pyruvate formate lyase activating enzyme